MPTPIRRRKTPRGSVGLWGNRRKMTWNYGVTTDFNPSGVMDQANTCENMIYIVITGVKEELH